MPNQIVDFYRQENPGTLMSDDEITLFYAEQYADQLPNLVKTYPDFGEDYGRIYDEAFPLTVGDRASQVAGKFVEGVAGTIASIPEAIGIARTEAFGRGLGVGTTDYRETLMGQLAEGIRGVGDYVSPEVAPTKAERMADSFWQSTVPGALGSGVGFIATGGVTSGVARTALGAGFKKTADKLVKEGIDKARQMPMGGGYIAQQQGKAAAEKYMKRKSAQLNYGSVGALGAAANATAGYKDALANGGTPDEALASYLLNGLVGTSEAMPLGRMLNRLDNASNGTAMYYLANASVETIEEAGQEVFQGVAGDIIAANIVKYDPDREMFADLERDAAAGGVSGAILSLLTSSLTRKVKDIEDSRTASFVENEGFTEPDNVERTVADARASYTGGREEEIKEVAEQVALQLELDPTGQDIEARQKIADRHKELVGEDADAQLIFEAELFLANTRRAADRASNVINTRAGEIANPEKRASRAIDDTIAVSPSNIVEGDTAGAYAQRSDLLNERNRLASELMDVNNDLNLSTSMVSRDVDPDTKANYEQMLDGRRQELSEQISELNKEIARINDGLDARPDPSLQLVDERRPQAVGLEERVFQAEQNLDIETRLESRIREHEEELAKTSAEEKEAAENAAYFNNLEQELADDRAALEELRQGMREQLEQDLVTLETTEQQLTDELREMRRMELGREDQAALQELIKETETSIQGVRKLKGEVREKLRAGVGSGQAAAKLGLSRDEATRLIRFTEGVIDRRPDTTPVLTAEEIKKRDQPLTAGELSAKIKGHNLAIARYNARLSAGQTTLKDGRRIVDEIAKHERARNTLQVKFDDIKDAEQNEALANNEDNARASMTQGARNRLEKQKERKDNAVKRFNELVDELDKTATTEEKARIQRGRSNVNTISKLQDRQHKLNVQIGNLSTQKEKAVTQKTKDSKQSKIDEKVKEVEQIERDIQKIAKQELGYTEEDVNDPDVVIDIGGKDIYDKIVDDFIKTNLAVEVTEQRISDQDKINPLDIRNIDIITDPSTPSTNWMPAHAQGAISEKESEKQDREQKAGPAYYEIGTNDATQSTQWGREATITLEAYNNATTAEEKARLAQELASQLARGATASDTSDTRRLISFVGPDGQIWVLGLHRYGRQKDRYAVVPPKTKVDSKAGYEGMLFEDLLAQGFVPFASIRLKTPVPKLNYRIDSVEEYQKIFEDIKTEVKQTPAFLGQVSQGAVSKVTSLDSIVEKNEPVFVGDETSRTGENVSGARGMEAARVGSAQAVVDEPTDVGEGMTVSEEAVVEDEMDIDVFEPQILTEEGALALHKVLDSIAEKEAAGVEISDLILEQELRLNDEELSDLLDSVGKASSENGDKFLQALTNLIKNTYETTETKEEFVDSFLSSEATQFIGEQIRKAAVQEANNELDNIVDKGQQQVDPNSREAVVSEAATTEETQTEAPATTHVEINSDGNVVRMTEAQSNDPAFRQANNLKKLEFYTDDQGNKQRVNQPSSGPKIASERSAPDRPDNAYPKVSQEKINKVFAFIIERLRNMGIQVELIESEFANAASEAKAVFGLANGKPVIVIAMNSLENPTTQNLYDLIHEVGHAVTADMPQKDRQRVLAAIAKLNDAVLKIGGRKYKFSLEDAESLDDVQQEERLVEAIAEALMSENFDPTTSGSIARKIVDGLKNVLRFVTQAFHRMMGNDSQVALNYFKVQVEAMLTGNKAPKYISWISGYKYSVDERMNMMSLQDSDSVINSIYDLSTLSKEYKLVVGDSPEAVEHNIRWAGIRFTVDRADMSEEDLAASKMEAQRTIAANNALNQILDGLFNSFKRQGGVKYSALKKEQFVNWLTKNLPDERIKKALEIAKDPDLKDTQMDDLEVEEARPAAAVILDGYLDSIQKQLDKMYLAANEELRLDRTNSTASQHKKSQISIVELTSNYENIEWIQNNVAAISEELAKGKADKADKMIDTVLKELRLKATDKEIENAIKRLRSDKDGKLIDAIEILAREISNWGKGSAKGIAARIAELGDPRLDVFKDAATLALTISVARNQPSLITMLALRREKDTSGVKRAFNKATKVAISGSTEEALEGWDSDIRREGGKTAEFERLTNKTRLALQKLIAEQEKSRAIHMDLETHKRDIKLKELLDEPLATYREGVGALFNKESIFPNWFESIATNGKEWTAVDGAKYVVPPTPESSITDLKNPSNHRLLNLLDMKNIGSLVQDIEKMNAWLKAQPAEKRGGEYNMIKRMVDRMTEVQAIQYHRELSNSFTVRLLGSMTDKLEMVGTPAAAKIAAQIKKFAYYIASHAGSGTKSAVRNGKIWSKKLSEAMAKVNRNGKEYDIDQFKAAFYSPAMQYFHHRRDILNEAPNREEGENRLIDSWINSLKAGDLRNDIAGAEKELKALYKQTAVNSRQIADISSKMGVLVYDEEKGYFRERIGSSISTTMRMTNDVARNVHGLLRDTWNRSRAATKKQLEELTQEEFENYVQDRFENTRTVNEFAAPIIKRPGASVFTDVDGVRIPRLWVEEAFENSRGPQGADMMAFLNELAVRAKVEEGSVRDFQAGIIDRFQDFFYKLDKVIGDQQEKDGFLDGERAVPMHVMMDARKFNDFPLEWVDYADFTERRMYQYVKNLAAESAFGRDMVQVANDFSLADNDLGAAVALHTEIEREIGRMGLLSRVTNWATRRYTKVYDELAAKKQEGVAGPKYSGKFLRDSVRTRRFMAGIETAFKSYLAKERDSALEFTVWNDLVRSLSGLIVQSPGTSLMDTISIVDQPYKKMGLNRFGFTMMANNIYHSLGIGAGSFFQIFNKSIKFAHDDMALMRELGLDDSTASLEGGWFKRFMTEFRSNMTDEMIGQNIFTRGVERASRGIRAFLETGIGSTEQGQGAFPVFRPQAIFSQIARQSGMANTISTWKLYRNFIANAANYIESHPEVMEAYRKHGMIFNEKALGAEGLNKALDEMGYGRSFLFFNNSKAYHQMYNTLNEAGFNIEKVALDYIERRKSDSKADPLDVGYAPENSLLMALAHTTSSQIMMETDVTTRAPGFLNNSLGYAAMPLFGWSVQKFVDVGKSMANDRNAHGLFVGTVESLKTYLAIFPIGMVYAFLRDEYDEEILGKKGSLQSGKGLFFKGDGMPSIEEIRTDPYNSLQVAVERFDRVGTFGFGGEVLNSQLNSESMRELSVDSRVYALNTLRTTGRVLTALAIQRDATYASVYRPLLQAYGGAGFLQYGQIVNNAMAKSGGDPLFEQEFAMAQRIGTNNYLRGTGRYLDLDVRTFSGAKGITPTRMRPHVSEMLMAAVVDDQHWFETAWSRAVEEAEAMGKEDPSDSVKRSFQAYHPLRYNYQTMPSQLEYMKILQTLEETNGVDARMQVEQTIRNINEYGIQMGIKPSLGKAKKVPSERTIKQQVFGDDFRKPNKRDILEMVMGI